MGPCVHRPRYVQQETFPQVTDTVAWRLGGSMARCWPEQYRPKHRGPNGQPWVGPKVYSRARAIQAVEGRCTRHLWYNSGSSRFGLGRKNAYSSSPMSMPVLRASSGTPAAQPSVPPRLGSGPSSALGHTGSMRSVSGHDGGRAVWCETTSQTARRKFMGEEPEVPERHTHLHTLL